MLESDFNPSLHGLMHHRISTIVLDQDPDQANFVVFNVEKSGGGGTFRIEIDGRENREALEQAIEAVITHDLLEGRFDEERSKGRDADIWFLQTLRKVTTQAHNDLPIDFKP